MEYQTGILLHAINEKVDWLIAKIQEGEKGGKEEKKQ